MKPYQYQIRQYTTYLGEEYMVGTLSVPTRTDFERNKAWMNSGKWRIETSTNWGKNWKKVSK